MSDQFQNVKFQLRITADCMKCRSNGRQLVVWADPDEFKDLTYPEKVALAIQKIREAHKADKCPMEE